MNKFVSKCLCLTLRIVSRSHQQEVNFIFLSVLKEAKKIDAEGVVSTMLPAGPEALNSGNNDDVIVMGKKWSELLSIMQEIGWNVHLFCPVRVHRSLVRAIVVCHPAD